VVSSIAGTENFTTTYTNGVFTLNRTPITLTGSSVSISDGFFIQLDSATSLNVPGNEGPNF
jgi:hypothetical protein